MAYPNSLAVDYAHTRRGNLNLGCFFSGLLDESGGIGYNVFLFDFKGCVVSSFGTFKYYFI